MPRKKVEKPEAVEEKTEETMDTTLDEQEGAAVSDPDKNPMEGTEGENCAEEISQTDMENKEDKKTPSSGTQGQEADSKMERQSDTEEVQEMSEVGAGEEIPQTDSGNPDSKVYPTEDASGDNGNPQNQDQSDTEASQAKNSGDVREKPSENPENQSESDTGGKNPKVQVPGEGVRRRRAGKSTGSVRLASPQVLAIDGHLVAETEAEKARNDLLDLIESQKTGRILTGTIQGVERQESNQSRSLAVIYHGEFKIIIPAEEAVEAPGDFRGGCRKMYYMTC